MRREATASLIYPLVMHTRSIMWVYEFNPFYATHDICRSNIQLFRRTKQLKLITCSGTQCYAKTTVIRTKFYFSSNRNYASPRKQEAAMKMVKIVWRLLALVQMCQHRSYHRRTQGQELQSATYAVRPSASEACHYFPD